MSNNSENDDLIAAFEARGGTVKRFSPGVKHAISGKKWDSIVQSGDRINARVASGHATVRSVPQNKTGGHNTLAGKDVPVEVPFLKKTPENAPVRHDEKTGPKGGGKVKTTWKFGGNTNRGGRAEVNTGPTPASIAATQARLDIERTDTPVQGPPTKQNKPPRDDRMDNAVASVVRNMTPDEREVHVHGMYNLRPKPPKVDPLSRTVSHDEMRGNLDPSNALYAAGTHSPNRITGRQENLVTGEKSQSGSPKPELNTSITARAGGSFVRGERPPQRAPAPAPAAPQPAPRPSVAGKMNSGDLGARVRARLRREEFEVSEEELHEKYVGFKKLADKVGPAMAAAIGRKKYGKKKFQKAAAEGRKMQGLQKEELFSDVELLRLQEIEAAFEADDLDEAKKRGGKRVPSINIPSHRFDKNSDQDGYNTTQDVASVNGGAPTISDEYVPESMKDGRYDLTAYHPTTGKNLFKTSAGTHDEMQQKVRDLADHGIKTNQSWRVVAEHPTGEVSHYKVGHHYQFYNGVKEENDPDGEQLDEAPKTVITADQPIKHVGQLPGSAAAPIQPSKLGSSLNGPKNPNKLQDVATKRDNAAPHTIEQTNEEDEVEVGLRAMIEPLHVLPVYNDSSRNTLLATWAVRNKARLR